MDLKDYHQLSSLFKALNHPVRLAILDLLHKDEACVCHLEAVLGQRQAYISQQLAVLREAGLIRDRREGWNVYYQVEDPEIFHLIQLARQHIFGEDAPEINFNTQNCPCPKCEAKKEIDGQTV
jgi:ArsR family transcriptional regulator